MLEETERAIAALVPAAREGDRRALDKLIALIHDPIVRYCRARMNPQRHPTPEDVAQDICLAVAQVVPRYEDQGRPFMAFVYGIAANKVADAHRYNARDRLQPSEEIPEVPDTSETPEEYALLNEGSNELRKLIDSLGERTRDIVIYRIFVGLSAEDTAELVGSTPGAVRVAQHRALATLRKKINEQGRDTYT